MTRQPRWILANAYLWAQPRQPAPVRGIYGFSARCELMPILGNDTKPGLAYHAYSGSSQINQEAEDIALPAQRVRILKLGAWIGGWNDAPRVYLCVWNPWPLELCWRSQVNSLWPIRAQRERQGSEI